VLYSVDDYYTVQIVTPSLSVSGSEHRKVTSEVIHTTAVPPIGSSTLYTERVSSLYTSSHFYISQRWLKLVLYDLEERWWL